MLKRMSVGQLLCDPYKSKAGWAAAGSVDADLSLLHFFELQRTDVAEGRRPLRPSKTALGPRFGNPRLQRDRRLAVPRSTPEMSSEEPLARNRARSRFGRL